ncbi:MAG: TspO/MBR family protein [Candidatus Micrarchaeia archaeon]|jgi:tryptophan-rich sensory protein
MVNLKELIIAILICQLAGIIGSIFTFDSVSLWYPTLVKPSFTPPSWVFAPVWITLYTLMGISLYWIYNSKLKDKKAFYVFGGQLILNALWSIVFFGFHLIFVSFLIIVLLWILILLTMVLFYKVDKKAGIILIPYLLWVSLATLLNYYLWILN